MLVQITRRADGSGVLRCVRDDGSVTWQKQNDRQAAFFALHDLTHFAVETVLDYQGGFFGLVREGWEIDDTTGKGARGPLPSEAGDVEQIVGMFFAEQVSRTLWSADEFNTSLAAQMCRRQLTDAEIIEIRKKRSELWRKWDAVPVGQALELEFPNPATSLASSATRSARRSTKTLS